MRYRTPTNQWVAAKYREIFKQKFNAQGYWRVGGPRYQCALSKNKLKPVSGVITNTSIRLGLRPMNVKNGKCCKISQEGWGRFEHMRFTI